MKQQQHDINKLAKRRQPIGMSLIEIIVGITILGLIAAAISIAVIPQLGKAKQDRAALDIKTIQGALNIYYARKGNYPDTATGMKALVDSQVLDPASTKDPWGHEYVYLNEGGKPVVISYGRDGAPGGEGEDADISSKDGATAKQ